MHRQKGAFALQDDPDYGLMIMIMHMRYVITADILSMYYICCFLNETISTNNKRSKKKTVACDLQLMQHRVPTEELPIEHKQPEPKYTATSLQEIQTWPHR